MPIGQGSLVISSKCFLWFLIRVGFAIKKPMRSSLARLSASWGEGWGVPRILEHLSPAVAKPTVREL